MSIYIKGVEMPKHDDEYVIFTVYGDGGVVYGPLNRPHVRYKDRAVPVPPHGRLIDADALMKRMWEETDCMVSVPATFVRDAPTIIPASGGWRVMEVSYETRKRTMIVDQSDYLNLWADLISRANEDALTFFGAEGDEV